MTAQVLRIESRRKITPQLRNHVLGKKQHRPATSYELDKRTQPIVLVDDPDARAYALKHQVKGRGRPACEAVEILVAGVPPYGSDEYTEQGWTPAREEAYARATLAWIRKCAGPRSRIAAAAWHRDESAGHGHYVLICVGCSNGRLGWTHVRKGFESTSGDGKTRMSRVQDSFHESVASAFGLARGVAKAQTQAEHMEIDRAKAAESKIRRSQEAEERAVQAKFRAKRAEEANATRERSLEVWEVDLSEREEGISHQEEELSYRENRIHTMWQATRRVAWLLGAALAAAQAHGVPKAWGWARESLKTLLSGELSETCLEEMYAGDADYAEQEQEGSDRVASPTGDENPSPG